MREKASPPRGYHTISPYIIVDGAEAMMSFLAAVFEATEKERITLANGRIGHAEMQLGDCVVMITDASDANPARSSAHYVFLDDVDATYRRALAAGATSRNEPDDKFYGNREAGLVDRWGNLWWIATAFEEVPPEELQARYDQTV